MAAAHYKQLDHVRRISARSFLTNISLDGSHKDTCYGKLVASRRHTALVETTADDGAAQESRSNDQLSQAIFPISGRELPDVVHDDVPAADDNSAVDGAADSKQQNLSESNLFRYMLTNRIIITCCGCAYVLFFQYDMDISCLVYLYKARLATQTKVFITLNIS